MAVRKSVLVQCGNFNRVVTFKCDESRVAVGATERDLLCEAIRVSYSERIGPNDRLTLQAKSEEWDGMLVDFFEDDVQDKMTLMLVVEKPEEISVHLSEKSPSNSAGEVGLEEPSAVQDSVNVTQPVECESGLSDNSKVNTPGIMCGAANNAGRQLTLSFTSSGLSLQSHSDSSLSSVHQQPLTEAYKSRIIDESRIYKRPESQLKSFEKRVNEAAKNLCLSDVSLLNRRGTLLELARKQVADEGYVFKKGHSRSKVYGYGEGSSMVTPKRPKYDEQMREDRLRVVEEELCDISRILQFKEKRLSQYEASKNYRLCEQLTEEMMALKSKRRELEAEKSLFVKKARRAKNRQVRQCSKRAHESESSDIDSSRPSSSRSVTPAQSFSRQSRLISPTSPTQTSTQSSPVSPLDMQPQHSSLSSPVSPRPQHSSLSSPVSALDMRPQHSSLSSPVSALDMQPQHSSLSYPVSALDMRPQHSSLSSPVSPLDMQPQHSSLSSPVSALDVRPQHSSLSSPVSALDMQPQHSSLSSPVSPLDMQPQHSSLSSPVSALDMQPQHSSLSSPVSALDVRPQHSSLSSPVSALDVRPQHSSLSSPVSALDMRPQHSSLSSPVCPLDMRSQHSSQSSPVSPLDPSQSPLHCSSPGPDLSLFGGGHRSAGSSRINPVNCDSSRLSPSLFDAEPQCTSSVRQSHF